MIIHYVNGQKSFASIGNKILCSTDGGTKWTQVTKLPLSILTRFKNLFQTTQRLFRLGVYHLLVLNKEQNLVIFGYHSIYSYDLKTFKYLSINVINGSKPLSICKTNNDVLYYGEYKSNPQRKPIAIYESKDFGQSWKKVYSFERIRHVHGIYFDNYSKNIWITTGDYKEEIGIWITKNNLV